MRSFANLGKDGWWYVRIHTNRFLGLVQGIDSQVYLFIDRAWFVDMFYHLGLAMYAYVEYTLQTDLQLSTAGVAESTSIQHMTQNHSTIHLSQVVSI
jgi:hypothetical protein